MELSVSLTHPVKLTCETGIFPQNHKTVKVVLIFKKETKKIVINKCHSPSYQIQVEYLKTSYINAPSNC